MPLEFTILKNSSAMKRICMFFSVSLRFCFGFLFCSGALADSNFRLLVTNEKSGDISVIDPVTQKVQSTIPVGKRPRGIRVSRDGRFAYIAVSGTPISAPPQLDAKG